jgi:hypothetical protein
MCDIAADFADDAGRLMTEKQIVYPRSLDLVQLRMTNSGRELPHLDLIRLGIG